MRFYWNLKIKYYVFLFLFVQCSNLTNVLGNVCPEYNFRGSVLQRNRNAKCYSCPRVYYSNETFKCTFVFNFFLYLLISVYRLFVVRVGSKIFRLVPIKKKNSGLYSVQMEPNDFISLLLKNTLQKV